MALARFAARIWRSRMRDPSMMLFYGGIGSEAVEDAFL